MNPFPSISPPPPPPPVDQVPDGTVAEDRNTHRDTTSKSITTSSTNNTGSNDTANKSSVSDTDLIEKRPFSDIMPKPFTAPKPPTSQMTNLSLDLTSTKITAPSSSSKPQTFQLKPPTAKPIPAPVKSIPRKRYVVAAGFGLADWTQLKRVSKDLAQLKSQPLRANITWEEISEHDSQFDGWMVLRGVVYNVTAYLAYHPGGWAIMEEVIGKDGTRLYDTYHQWINIGGLIGSLKVGTVENRSCPT